MYKLLKKLKRALRRKIRGDYSQRLKGDESGRSYFWIGLITLFAIIFSSFLFPVAQVFIPPSTPKVGEYAPEDIITPVQFTVYKSDEELAVDIEEALAQVPAVLHYDQKVVDSLFTSLDRLLFMVDSLKQKIRRSRRIADKLRLFYPHISKTALVKMAASEIPGEIRGILLSNLSDRFFVGILPPGDTIPSQFKRVAIKKNGREYHFGVDQVLDREEAGETLRDDIEGTVLSDSTDTQFLYDIGGTFLMPNLRYSILETERRQELARESVGREKIVFEAGRRLVAKNQQITKTHVEWLTALAEYRSDRGLEMGAWQYLLPILARVAFVAFIFISLLISFYYLRGRDEFCFSRVFPLLLVLLLTLVAVYFISEQWELPSYLFPVAGGIILVVILYDVLAAILTTIAGALLLGVLFNFNFEIAFLATVSGVVATYSMYQVQKRSDFYRCALYLALALVAATYVLESLKFAAGDLILRQCGFAIANALISTVIAMALLPLFESLFSFTTDVTLLELSDMNHPLLKRLALEAPGTYQHSLVVGNLAEAAAKEIGADSLLARVGAYYHDIGKSDISEYFIENQFGLKSKHDELTPTMSALVIGSHIKKGRELAEEFDLPDQITDFIEQHHGTSIMTFFYNKAKNLSDNGDVSEAEFRYPGPRPHSRETAIVMIADTVEAASRTLEDPKPARIRGLVRRLIGEKYRSGELSQSNLTLADLQKIEDAFVKLLIGMFHSRIDYPAREEESSA